MAATNYVTKIYNITRGGESQEYAEEVTSQTSTSTVFFIGPVWYSVNGTLGGATVRVQSRQVVTATASATYVDIANTTANEAIDKLIDFPPHVPNYLKAIIANASSTTDLFVRFQAGSGRDTYD